MHHILHLYTSDPLLGPLAPGTTNNGASASLTMDPQRSIEFLETTDTVDALDNGGNKNGSRRAAIETVEQELQCPPEYRTIDKGNASSRSITYSYGVGAVKSSSEGRGKVLWTGCFSAWRLIASDAEGTGEPTTSGTDHLAAMARSPNATTINVSVLFPRTRHVMKASCRCDHLPLDLTQKHRHRTHLFMFSMFPSIWYVSILRAESSAYTRLRR